MILHIMPDEKIINRTIFFFESVFPFQNKYIILLSEDKLSPVRVDERTDIHVSGAHFDTEYFWEQVGNIDMYDKIVIHFLSYDAAKFINKISHKYLYWIEWGADLYNVFLYRRGFKLYNDEKFVCKMKHPNLSYCMYKCLHKIYTYRQ